MAHPIKHLPVIQNWSCHVCGNCCTDYWVPVTDSERARIEGQGWSRRPEFQGRRLFKRFSPWWKFWDRRYRLNQVEGDRCVFLNEKGLCRIHAEFGENAKPFACQLYPYILVPVGDHYRLSLRFACPSATASKGRPLAEQMAELKHYAAQLEAWERGQGHVIPQAGTMPPPPLQGRQTVPWGDLERIVEALVVILRDRSQPMTRRILKCIAMVRNCQQASYEKISGHRLREFLDLMRVAAEAEVPRDLSKWAKPGWIGRVLFRTFLTIYLRKDQGSRRGVSRRGRLALFWATLRMMLGSGRLPRLQAGLPEARFRDFEPDAQVGDGPPPSESADSVDELLERYYTIKLNSFQFCGVSYYGFPFWDGVYGLMLTYPLIRWLARGYRELAPRQALEKAINVIDENYAYSPFLGLFRQRLALKILCFRQDLDRLVAWYGR